MYSFKSKSDEAPKQIPEGRQREFRRAKKELQRLGLEIAGHNNNNNNNNNNSNLLGNIN
jgi:hypothetical protein